jgi:3-oxoacyl-[acyl-carrier protein] reductase
MDLRLDGRHVLVSGATRGIGRAITLALARSGATVLGCYRTDGEHVEALGRQLKQLGGDHHLFRADVSRAEDVLQLAEECRRRYGSLDVLVHNAGTISHVPFAELPAEQWQLVLDTNLTAAYRLTQSALPLLADGASVVFIGSKVASVGVPLRSHYTAAKAGLVGLARSLSKELGPHGIRVNVVAPGVIDTAEPGRMEPTAYEQLQERLAQYRARTPLGRLGSPEDVAGAVLFLASDLSVYVTGETLHVDGGI